MKKKTLALASMLLAGALTLTACGEDADSAAGSAGHNEADVTFAQDMIPHHAQAVQMSKMATDNADSEEVRALAEDISAAQGPEIETMTGWLEDWDEEVPDTSMMSGDMGDMDMEDMDMPGMMSSEEMKGLDGASGSAFDQMFLTMMIEHHEGAIEQAQTEQADGESAEAVDLAAEIEQAQTEEIATMEDLLAS